MFNGNEVNQSDITLTSRGTSNDIEQDYDLQIRILNDALDGHIDEAYRLANNLKLEEITQNSTVQKGIVLGRSRGTVK